MAVHNTARRKLTYEDYLLFPEDGNRHEILDGEHYVSPARTPLHQQIVVTLTLWLGSFVREHRLGRLLIAPTDVVLSEHDVTQPDLLFISNERSEILTEKNIQGAPDLVIEVLSESTRRTDEGIKRERYEQLGVQEYWIVDRWRRSVRVYRRQERRFELAVELTAGAGDHLTSPLLPGFDLPIAEIFV
ncbi:MAG TPA: Uma2 family endonuclease [Thermoanaerobaculia bacterium]